MKAGTSTKKRTAYFKGRGKNSDKKYKVQRFKDGKVFCTCPGFMFGFYDQRPCWHVKQAIESWK